MELHNIVTGCQHGRKYQQLQKEATGEMKADRLVSVHYEMQCMTQEPREGSFCTHPAFPRMRTIVRLDQYNYLGELVLS